MEGMIDFCVPCCVAASESNPQALWSSYGLFFTIATSAGIRKSRVRKIHTLPNPMFASDLRTVCSNEAHVSFNGESVGSLLYVTLPIGPTVYIDDRG